MQHSSLASTFKNMEPWPAWSHTYKKYRMLKSHIFSLYTCIWYSCSWHFHTCVYTMYFNHIKSHYPCLILLSLPVMSFFFSITSSFCFLSYFLITHWVQSWYIYTHICVQGHSLECHQPTRDQSVKKTGSSSQNSHQQLIIAPQRRPMCWNIFFKHFNRWPILK